MCKAEGDIHQGQPVTFDCRPGTWDLWRKPESTEISSLSLHLSALAGFPLLLSKPSIPTWPGVPSFLARAQEGVGSSQNVSIGFRGRLGNWKLSAVSLATSSQIILGMEEGGELCAGQPREAASSPRKTSVPHYLCQSGPVRRQKPGIC